MSVSNHIIIGATGVAIGAIVAGNGGHRTEHVHWQCDLEQTHHAVGSEAADGELPWTVTTNNQLITKTGAGVVQLTTVAGDTIAGGLTVDGGTLNIAPSANSITVSGVSKVSAGGTLQITGFGVGVTHTGALNNSGLVRVDGTGTSVFSGVTKNDGVLQVAGMGTVADFGTSIISSTSQLTAGLREGGSRPRGSTPRAQTR